MIVTTRILFYITDFNSWKASNAATGDEVSNLYLKNNNNKQTKSKKQKKKRKKKTSSLRTVAFFRAFQ